ncbi:hypothetical protein NL676_037559 [Syzygium grande]|nr:hypothetical protein NL676_037559 [Syzygium grande]
MAVFHVIFTPPPKKSTKATNYALIGRLIPKNCPVHLRKTETVRAPLHATGDRKGARTCPARSLDRVANRAAPPPPLTASHPQSHRDRLSHSRNPFGF